MVASCAAATVERKSAAHESTILEQLRYSMYRYQGISRGFPVKVQIDNVKPEDAVVLNRVYPFPGEEGQFTGVRFTPKKTFGVSEVDFTAPNGAKFGVNCTVDEDRIINLYVFTDSRCPMSRWWCPARSASRTATCCSR